MTTDDFWQSVRTFIRLATESEALEAFDKVPTKKIPDGEYCTITISSLAPYGQPVHHDTAVFDEDGITQIGMKRTYTTAQEAIVDVYFFRGNSIDRISKIHGSYVLESVRQHLFETDTNIWSIDDIEKDPKEVSTKYESRSGVAITFVFNLTRVEQFGFANSADVILNVDDNRIYPQKELKNE